MEGFLTNKHGLIPYNNQWMVISGNEQLKVFWCYTSGVEYINKLERNKESKSRKKANKGILNPDPAIDTTLTVTANKSIKKKRLK